VLDVLDDKEHGGTEGKPAQMPPGDDPHGRTSMESL